MRTTTINLIFLFTLAFLSCAGLTKETTNTWLKSKAGAASVNLTGIWDTGSAMSGGWGECKLFQEADGRVYGTLGGYYVEASVNGENIYMVISSKNKIYYTVLLKKIAEDQYMGKAISGMLCDDPKAQNADVYMLTLKKVQ